MICTIERKIYDWQNAKSGLVLDGEFGRAREGWHSSWVTSVAFSPDGKQIVSGSDDGTVRLWDAATGALQQPLERYSSWVTSVAFSPDGKLLPSLRVSSDWVVEGTSNILWLPPDYLPTCEAIWNGIIVLGYLSGRISLFTFAQGTKLII